VVIVVTNAFPGSWVDVATLQAIRFESGLKANSSHSGSLFQRASVSTFQTSISPLVGRQIITFPSGLKSNLLYVVGMPLKCSNLLS